MLAKTYRLSKNKDFEKVFSKGKSFKAKYIFLKILKNNLSFSRFGFIISKKVSKKSVERHKIKRRMSDVVRSKIKEIKEGWDIVIMANPQIKEKSYQEIEAAIEDVLKSAELIQ